MLYEIEISGEMNIFITFNIRDVTPYIKDKDEGHKDFRENPLQGEFDVEQKTQGNLLNNIKVLV